MKMTRMKMTNNHEAVITEEEEEFKMFEFPVTIMGSGQYVSDAWESAKDNLFECGFNPDYPAEKFGRRVKEKDDAWVRAEGVEPETVLTELFDEHKPEGVSFNRFSELAMNYIKSNIDDILDLLEEEE